MEDHEIRPVIEALLFVSSDILSVDRLGDLLAGVDKERIRRQISLLQKEYGSRGIQIVEIGGGYQMVTCAEVAPWLKEFEKMRNSSRLSRAGLETLAIIAYKQPLTRAEIEAIRGVDTAGPLKTLMDRRMVKIVGRKEVAGRPLMYGTTRAFLKYFGLSNLSSLPTLKEFSEAVETPEESNDAMNPRPLSEASEEMEMPLAAVQG